MPPPSVIIRVFPFFPCMSFCLFVVVVVIFFWGGGGGGGGLNWSEPVIYYHTLCHLAMCFVSPP